MMQRKLHQTESGNPVLIEIPDGVVFKVSEGELLDIEATDAEWEQMRKDQKRGRLNYDKVKENHAKAKGSMP